MITSTSTECPVCGSRVYIWEGTGADWIGVHAPGPGMPHVPLYGPGRLSCFIGGLSPEEAVAIARILRTGGDRLLRAAHP
jgi:hypothetical protein